jgi:hypothetical protein
MLEAQRSCAVPRSLLQLGSGHIVRRRILQEAYRPRDALSKACIVQRTHCLGTVWSKTKRSGTHRPGVLIIAFQTKMHQRQPLLHNFPIPLFQWTVAGQPGLLGPPAARTVFTTGRWQTAYKLIPLKKRNQTPFFGG